MESGLKFTTPGIQESSLYLGRPVPLGKSYLVAVALILLPDSTKRLDEDGRNQAWQSAAEQIEINANSNLLPQFMIPYGKRTMEDGRHVMGKTVLFVPSLSVYLLGQLYHGKRFYKESLKWQKVSNPDVDTFLGLKNKSGQPITKLTPKQERNLKFTTIIDLKGNPLSVAEHVNEELKNSGRRQFHLFERKILRGDNPVGLNLLTRAVSGLTKIFSFNVKDTNSPIAPFVPNPEWQKKHNIYYVRLTIQTDN